MTCSYPDSIRNRIPIILWPISNLKKNKKNTLKFIIINLVVRVLFIFCIKGKKAWAYPSLILNKVRHNRLKNTKIEIE